MASAALTFTACVLAGMAAGSALAQNNPELQPVEARRAQEQMGQGNYEDAVRTLEQGLNGPELSDGQLVELYRLLGLAHLYLGEESKAQEAYTRLLQARPDYELPRSTPPKIRELYARIKADIKRRRLRPMSLALEPLLDRAGGAPVPVTVRLQDLSLGAKAKLFYRRAGSQAFTSTEFTKEPLDVTLYRATIPAFEVPKESQTYSLEYYVEVADAAQRRLAGRGDAYEPLRFRLLATDSALSADGSQRRAWYKSPWVWVGAGVVVGGAAVTTGVLLNSTPSSALNFTIRVNNP